MFEKKEEKLCELCKEPATNICFDCQFYLCETCFEFLHSKKANTLHKKEESIRLFLYIQSVRSIQKFQ